MYIISGRLQDVVGKYFFDMVYSNVSKMSKIRP